MLIKYQRPYYLSFIFTIFISSCGIPDIKELIKIDRFQTILEIDKAQINIETKSSSEHRRCQDI